MDDENSVEVLPCGCSMSTVGKTFLYEPCSLTCEYYLYMLSVAEEQNLTLNYLEI